MTAEQAQHIVEEIKKKTETKAYSLKINTGRDADIFDTKFGGLPYWDNMSQYPADDNGNRLALLAQINFDRFPNDERLPQNGILQFFILCDDEYLYGMDFDKSDSQKTFRIVYHKEINYDVKKEEIEKMGFPVCGDEYSPLYGEYAVDVTEIKTYLGIEDYKFNALYRKIAKEMNIDLPDDKNLYSVLGKDFDKLYDSFSCQGHSVLGYPFFTQTDPRGYKEEYRRYDTLLLQIDSDFGKDYDYVMWGDSGVANFFINSEDLKKGDFSSILYNWDCC